MAPVPVTAKFKVARKIPMGVTYDVPTGEWSGKPWAFEVELTPDYAEGRNKEWAEATPSGIIRLTIKNELAAEQFTIGASYTVTFELEPPN